MTAEGDGGSRVDPTLDGILAALSGWRGRCVVYHLEETDDGLASFDDLADVVLEQETETTSSDRVAAILHHRTLPRLQDGGLVEYDTRSGAVRYRSDETTEALLDCIREVAQGED